MQLQRQLDYCTVISRRFGSALQLYRMSNAVRSAFLATATFLAKLRGRVSHGRYSPSRPQNVPRLP